MAAQNQQKRLHDCPFRFFLSTKMLVFASRPYIEGRLAYYRKRLVFRLSSTPKRLLKNSQWRLCLGAIMEFTAAGQSGILTRFTKWTFSRLSRVQMNLTLHSTYENVPNLSTAKCTFTGDSFQNHVAKVRLNEQNTKYYMKKLSK